MQVFKQLLGYIKKDFDIEEKEELEINLEFVKTFHKEFNKYHDKFETMEFLFIEEFKELTPISQWFKNNKDHEKFEECKNNLYALVCVSQDIVGNEMLKDLNNINPENMHEYIQNIIGGDNSPLSEMFEKSPLGDLLKNPELKGTIEKVMNQLKNINFDELLKNFTNNEGGMPDLSNIMNSLSGLGGDNPALSSAMSLLGGMLGEDDELSGLTPQQKAKIRAERRRTEYRRKIRAREKAKSGNGNRKKRKKRG